MASQESDEVLHENPTWRDKANFIIAARIDPSGVSTPLRWEQLWARQLGEDRFEVCCIPFFVYDLALGDEVETGIAGEDRYVVKRVLRRSGRFTFRIWFKDESARKNTIERLVGLGCLVEWRWPGGKLAALDAATPDLAQDVANFLMEKERQGELEYETGRTT